MLEKDITEVVTRLVFQLAVILLVAKMAGELCERYLKIPPVLGELAAGIVIGPHVLGSIALGGLGPLFESPEGGLSDPISFIPRELWFLGQIAAVVLLFATGLETNLRQFLRYVGPASAVALGGVLLPFFLGAGATILFGFADGFTDPEALFMGAVMTATSVGITARVLGDLRYLGSPEGVTILGAAVVDDVLGILVLTVVVGIADTGEVSLLDVGIVSAKAIGFWVVLTGVGILIASRLSRLVLAFKVAGGAVALSLFLALLAAGLAESFGLAMIIGAYSIGLALSGSELAKRVDGPLQGLYHALVPVFFVVMGMLVDISAMREAIVFGVVITLLAIVSKLIGAGLPALGTGFNARGALRIGLGMIPRGEVALIIAGIGLAHQTVGSDGLRHPIIGSDVFGVVIMMTAVTTLIAPILLVPVFKKGGDGRRNGGRDNGIDERGAPPGT